MSIQLIPRDPLEKSDVLVVLTGNGFERTDHAVKLFKAGWAPLLLMVGSTGSRPPKEMAAYAVQNGVPENCIRFESQSSNTRQNADNVLKIATDNSWMRIILITSPHHQLRAHLSFRMANQKLGGRIKIINHPPAEYSWFDLVESSRGKDKKVLRFFYIFSELFRILKYRIKGDL
ncbi:MAG: Uncharacterized protein G01um10143_187 [Parcubacteria group bacterium Gr01-1014_3]|nr:MAG: Uncharacterized protein G01um10143_187 [Parcubacteria group bacterium Gr01-1014_3]